MAILLHCKSLLVFVENPGLVYPLIAKIEDLREDGHQSDFTLLKYLVKTMCGYMSDFEIS
jgi:hypothetical protein